MKKLLISLLTLSLIAFVSCTSAPKTTSKNAKKTDTLFDASKAVKDNGNKNFSDVTAIDLVRNMKTGWNLGNTLDATGSKGLNSETCWGQPKTTKEMIDTLAASGIKTIRIPTSWSNHIIDGNYTIDPNWTARVKEIVDWAIEDDMYVILNSHHDNWINESQMVPGKGYYPNNVNLELSKEYLKNVWAQICLAFNDGYDEHLVFETMNEPRQRGTEHEWWTDPNCPKCLEAGLCLNELNQTALDTIRASGGNNAKRFVMVPGLRAGPDSVLKDPFKLPEDSSEGRLIISVHMYSPNKFAMEAPGDIHLTNNHKYSVKSTFDGLKAKYIYNGIPVVIGEYGATNKDNLEDRVEWFNFFLRYSRKFGMTSVLWDNGSAKPSRTESERFGYFNRKELCWYFPEITAKINEVISSEEQ